MQNHNKAFMNIKGIRDVPRECLVHFDATCSETGALIHKGSFCLWFPIEKKIFSLASQRYKEYLTWVKGWYTNAG